ncbi:hypothetical protein D3C75_1339620 [compost metagenome]
MLTKAFDLSRRQVRVQGVDRLAQGQADDTLDRILAALRLTGTLGGGVHGLDDTPDRVGQRAVPVEDQ